MMYIYIYIYTHGFHVFNMHVHIHSRRRAWLPQAQRAPSQTPAPAAGSTALRDPASPTSTGSMQSSSFSRIKQKEWGCKEHQQAPQRVCNSEFPGQTRMSGRKPTTSSRRERANRRRAWHPQAASTPRPTRNHQPQLHPQETQHTCREQAATKSTTAGHAAVCRL